MTWVLLVHLLAFSQSLAEIIRLTAELSVKSWRGEHGLLHAKLAPDLKANGTKRRWSGLHGVRSLEQDFPGRALSRWSIVCYIGPRMSFRNNLSKQRGENTPKDTAKYIITVLALHEKTNWRSPPPSSQREKSCEWNAGRGRISPIETEGRKDWRDAFLAEKIRECLETGTLTNLQLSPCVLCFSQCKIPLSD